jgi:hypothetical protein
VIRLRLSEPAPARGAGAAFGSGVRHGHGRPPPRADEFYAGVIPRRWMPMAANVMRQALAACSGPKQFYTTDVDRGCANRGPDPSSGDATRRRATIRWHHM